MGKKWPAFAMEATRGAISRFFNPGRGVVPIWVSLSTH